MPKKSIPNRTADQALEALSDLANEGWKVIIDIRPGGGLVLQAERKQTLQYTTATHRTVPVPAISIARFDEAVDKLRALIAFVEINHFKE